MKRWLGLRGSSYGPYGPPEYRLRGASYEAQTMAIPRITGHTWAPLGEVKATETFGIHVVRLATGEEKKLVRADYSLKEGTSCTVKVLRNGTEATGFGALSVTSAGGSTAPTAIKLEEGDKLSIEVTAVSGTPKSPSVTLQLESIA